MAYIRRSGSTLSRLQRNLRVHFVTPDSKHENRACRLRLLYSHSTAKKINLTTNMTLQFRNMEVAATASVLSNAGVPAARCLKASARSVALIFAASNILPRIGIITYDDNIPAEAIVPIANEPQASLAGSGSPK
jgi:hypothetical protein